MNVVQANQPIPSGSSADRRILIDGLTLISLGLSVLFLNSWHNPFVSTSIGLFWGTFFLILNWSSLVQTFRGLRQKNDRRPRSSYESASQWR
jgi:hypothetical protein